MNPRRAGRGASLAACPAAASRFCTVCTARACASGVAAFTGTLYSPDHAARARAPDSLLQLAAVLYHNPRDGPVLDRKQLGHLAHRLEALHHAAKHHIAPVCASVRTSARESGPAARRSQAHAPRCGNDCRLMMNCDEFLCAPGDAMLTTPSPLCLRARASARRARARLPPPAAPHLRMKFSSLKNRWPIAL